MRAGRDARCGGCDCAIGLCSRWRRRRRSLCGRRGGRKVLLLVEGGDALCEGVEPRFLDLGHGDSSGWSL